jgi:hypothetical protein
MKDETVPDGDHVARHCKGTQLKEDGTVSGTAFRLRAGRDDYLSVNWLEFLVGQDRVLQMAALRDAYRVKVFDLRATARFAVVNVGEIRDHVRERSEDARALRVLHEPFNKAEHGFDDPSHAGIFGYSPDDDLIADLIAQVVREIHPAKG